MSTRRESKLVILDDSDGWTYYEPGKGPKRKGSRPSPFYLSRWYVVLVLVAVTLAYVAGTLCGWCLCNLLR